ncbi:sister chromatid cohesion protein Ctf8 [Cryptosporidium felis]|nr:sister chromatid cohesion protein Ctf8 [Cryptosporidium felis]
MKEAEGLTVVPISLAKSQNKRLILLEFQGVLTVSKLDSETGDITNSKDINDFNDTVIGKLVNFKSSIRESGDSPGDDIDSLIEFSKSNPIELKVGYYTLIGKIVKLAKPLAVIQNQSRTQEQLMVYDIISYKLVFESRPLFTS